MKAFDSFLRAAAIACVLVAGSCAAATNDAQSIASDGAVNHPIAVEPNFREIKLQFAGGEQGLAPDAAAQFDNFLADYRAHGNGSLGISVPNGPPARAAITALAERAAATGISRDKILVSTHDVQNGDFRVDVSYITYTASTDSCGDWSENLAFSADNLTPKNFGCSVQHNMAAMVADPRDLLGPRRFDPADANRAQTVIGAYEAGKITSAEKSQDQSGAISDVNKQ
ncbi:MAG TPA: CpaD family pilus assembly protein [Rhizomicrobium sp.]|nr:CpaD family pilus assembly protein [Rhizomicrobium sp.]